MKSHLSSLQEHAMGISKRNEFQPTSSLLKLLQGLPGYQHQHVFITLTSPPSVHAAGMEVPLDGVESLSGSKTV